MLSVRRSVLFFTLSLFVVTIASAQQQVEIWKRFEHSFTSSKSYQNALYDVRQFTIRFTSPTGRIKKIAGFWDGGMNWKVRFAPDEKGIWNWESGSSDSLNSGLHGVKGSFECIPGKSKLQIYQHGSVIHPKGSYHLTYADGEPFFFAGCTAWNGTLKSTEAEWETYLSDRAASGYTVIQFVTTQWRGGDKNSLGQVAFEGAGHIRINPAFFQHLDGKIDRINEHGLVAAPVLLWALGTLQGRELSPGYYLPEEEAILLARYMVARYGGNHVMWILGGDGKYIDENEQRWKNIGKGVFRDEHPGVVALHSQGGSWVGNTFTKEGWLDVIGYQSGHNRAERTINFINKGPVSREWHTLPPGPVINMEPVYEEIGADIRADDVRNAAYWSVLAAPVAGITYGANGLWPWLRKGEKIINHRATGEGTSRWDESIKLPGSKQIGYLSKFFQQLDWWHLKPAPELLTNQPGDKDARQFVSVSATEGGKLIVAYLPTPALLRLYNRNDAAYEASWFNPVTNTTVKGSVTASNGLLEIQPPNGSNDFLLVLKKK